MHYAETKPALPAQGLACSGSPRQAAVLPALTAALPAWRGPGSPTAGAVRPRQKPFLQKHAGGSPGQNQRHPLPTPCTTAQLRQQSPCGPSQRWPGATLLHRAAARPDGGCAGGVLATGMEAPPASWEGSEQGALSQLTHHALESKATVLRACKRQPSLSAACMQVAWGAATSCAETCPTARGPATVHDSNKVPQDHRLTSCSVPRQTR